MANDQAETIELVIEIPRGNRNKYEYDESQCVIRLDRVLLSSIHYPIDCVGQEKLSGEQSRPKDGQ